MQNLKEVTFILDDSAIKQKANDVSSAEVKRTNHGKGVFLSWEKVSFVDRESGKRAESVVGKIKDLDTGHIYSILPQNIFFSSIIVKLNQNKTFQLFELTEEQKAKVQMMKTVDFSEIKSLPFCIKEVRIDSNNEISANEYLAIFWDDKTYLAFSTSEKHITSFLNDIIFN